MARTKLPRFYRQRFGMHFPECKDTHFDFNEVGSWGYRKISNIRCTLVGNKIVDHSDVVGASPVCSNYIFILNWTPGFSGFGKDNCKTRRETFMFGDWVRLILENWRYKSAGADNGWPPNWWQAITWTNDGKVLRHYMASLCYNGLTHKFFVATNIATLIHTITHICRLIMLISIA